MVPPATRRSSAIPQIGQSRPVPHNLRVHGACVFDYSALPLQRHATFWAGTWLGFRGPRVHGAYVTDISLPG